MKARPLTEPASDQRCLVRGVVVEDEMDVEVQWHRVIDGVEKLAELHGAMAAMTPADHRAGLDVQCREERRRAMAHVVMGAAFGLARAHRQQWLRAALGFAPSHRHTTRGRGPADPGRARRYRAPSPQRAGPSKA